MKPHLKISGIGTWLALICAIHCALTPIVISITPVFAGSLFNSEWVELAVIGSGFVLAGYTIFKDYLNLHNRWESPLIVSAGALVVLSGFLFLPHEGQHFSTLAGALLLITGHIVNAIHKRKCNCATACKV